MGEQLRKTPYHDLHVRNGGKMVSFAGWSMPVQFRNGILHEHRKVRGSAGVFDVSHMGRIYFRGPGAVAFANYWITNNLDKSGRGRLLYGALCNHEGGIIDDVTVYHLGDEILMVVNAANAEAVWSWASKLKPDDVEMVDATLDLAQIALQGPQAESCLAAPFDAAVKDVGYYGYAHVSWEGAQILISRNGYTGEDGFEIYVPTQLAVPLWETLFRWGSAAQLEPVGLGARDTLRMEVNYALYGNELNTDVSPLEAGLRWVVKLKKGDFVGREALLAQKKAGLRRTLVGFEVAGKRLPRHGHPIRSDDEEVGVVTSGGYCPSLDRGMGMGFVPPELAEIGTPLAIDARGALLEAKVIERPFYKKGSVRR